MLLYLEFYYLTNIINNNKNDDSVSSEASKRRLIKCRIKILNVSCTCSYPKSKNYFHPYLKILFLLVIVLSDLYGESNPAKIYL
jgi:hypothetical protein